MFITDGYGNSRVAHFGADGMFIKDCRRGDLPGQFNTPHAIVIDNKGTLYVGDRQNRRIQVFDENGTPLKDLEQLRRDHAPCASPRGRTRLSGAWMKPFRPLS